MDHATPGRKILAARLMALAAALGNVSEACRRLDVDRSSYYRWKRAPLGSPRPGKSMAGTEVERQILKLSREFPEWGCDRIAYCLKLTSLSVSSPTVQKILILHGLGRKTERMKRAAG